MFLTRIFMKGMWCASIVDLILEMFLIRLDDLLYDVYPFIYFNHDLASRPLSSAIHLHKLCIQPIIFETNHLQ